jgi:hypothetical protein
VLLRPGSSRHKQTKLCDEETTDSKQRSIMASATGDSDTTDARAATAAIASDAECIR